MDSETTTNTNTYKNHHEHETELLEMKDDCHQNHQHGLSENDFQPREDLSEIGGQTSRQEPPADQLPNYNHQCYICDKIFSANSNLNRHLRKIHKENVQSPYNNVKCALCDSVYSSSQIYNQHLEQEHQVKIEVENLTFATKGTFENWKHQVENETTSQFIKSRGQKRTKDVNKTYYSCNRSGYYVSKARTRKALKKQGSRKINGRCPASMNVTVNSDSTYDVRFVKTHVGHNFELKHLDLSDKDRDLIVQKLVSGVTKRDIIRQLRLSYESQQQQTQISQPNNTSVTPITFDPSSSNLVPLSTTTNVELVPSTIGNDDVSVLVGSTITATVFPAPTSGADTSNNSCTFVTTNNHPTSRLHMATTKDIHNIIHSKHLDSKLIRHNYDLNNVEAWINEMKDFEEISSVLFYKSQSELVCRFSQLREEDFMLLIMKDGQSQVLKEHGNKCIIIDSTHNINCEYLHVAILSTIDENEQAFPVAFMFSNRTDADLLEVFFTLIRDKVGVLAPKVFLTDELDDFYNAWSKVMTRPTYNLLTPWSVFDRWTKKLDLIKNKDKLRKLRKSLRSLLNETNEDKLREMLDQFSEDHGCDDEVEEFVKYFKTSFATNPGLWSSCLRKVNGISTQRLNKLHDKFKIVYKEGKTSKKLCKYIASLMTLFNDNQRLQLSKLEDKNPAKQKALQDRHRKSLEDESCVYELALEPVMWLCPSESTIESYYEVKPEYQVANHTGKASTAASDTTDDARPKCNCDLICAECTSCRHAYRCTCLDYVVNLNMCMHIHRICTMCK